MPPKHWVEWWTSLNPPWTEWGETMRQYRARGTAEWRHQQRKQRADVIALVGPNGLLWKRNPKQS